MAHQMKRVVLFIQAITYPLICFPFIWWCCTWNWTYTVFSRWYKLVKHWRGRPNNGLHKEICETAFNVKWDSLFIWLYTEIWLNPEIKTKILCSSYIKSSTLWIGTKTKRNLKYLPRIAADLLVAYNFWSLFVRIYWQNIKQYSTS